MKDFNEWKRKKQKHNDFIDAIATGITFLGYSGNNLQFQGPDGDVINVPRLSAFSPASVTVCSGPINKYYPEIDKYYTEKEITNILNPIIEKDKEGEDKDMEKVKFCPMCGARLIVKTSRYGIKFWGCTNYPECNYTRDFNEEKDSYIETNRNCEDCVKQNKQVCNSACACRDEQCDEVDRTPLEALFYGCDLKGIYINDKNGTITCVNTDGETFSAKISGSDEFDPRIGVALVLAYNFMGSKGSFNSAVKELMNSKRFHITKKEQPKDKQETKEDAKENN